jgi:D-sedoheptulose 7-phosphate isomerase
MELNPKIEQIYRELFIEYPLLNECKNDILDSFQLLKNCFDHKGKILICGNGGSAADAEHIVGELLKGFIEPRPINEDFLYKLKALYPKDALDLGRKIQEAFPAISLVGQTAFSTAFANDVSPDTIFAQQVYALGLEQDVLWGISTSGNSRNVINAIKISRAIGMKSIGLTGHSGGEIKRLCDIAICVPGIKTYRIQELHMPVYHALCAMLEAEFFSRKKI